MSDYQITVKFSGTESRREEELVKHLSTKVLIAVQDWHEDFGQPLSIVKEVPEVTLERLDK